MLCLFFFFAVVSDQCPALSSAGSCFQQLFLVVDGKTSVFQQCCHVRLARRKDCQEPRAVSTQKWRRMGGKKEVSSTTVCKHGKGEELSNALKFLGDNMEGAS